MSTLYDEVAEAVQGFRDGQPLIEPDTEAADDDLVLGEIPEELRPLYSAYSADCDRLHEACHQSMRRTLAATMEALSDPDKLLDSPESLEDKLEEIRDGVQQDHNWFGARNQILKLYFWTSLCAIFRKTPPGTSLSVRKGWKVVASQDPEPEVQILGLETMPPFVRRQLEEALRARAGAD